MASPKDVVDRSLAAWEARDPDAFAQCYSESADIVGPGGMLLHGQAGARQLFVEWLEAVPDHELVIHNEYMANSVLIQEGTFSGTHTGNMVSPDGETIPPTGRRFTCRHADIYVIEGDRIRSDHIYFDQIELLAQLGIMPNTTVAGGN